MSAINIYLYYAKTVSINRVKLVKLIQEAKTNFEKNMASLAVVVHVKSKEMVELEVLQLELI